MFGHDGEPSISYRYGLRCPDKPTSDRLIEIMRQAHRYYNRLIETYRRQTEAAQAARRKRFPNYEALETQAAELDMQVESEQVLIKSANAAAKRKMADPIQRARIGKLKSELAEVRAKLKAMREILKDDPDLQAEWDAIGEAGNAERRKARAECGVYWGTYLTVENAAKQASQKSHGMPRFKRWDGGGRVAVQLQGGLSVEDAFGGSDTRLRIDDLPNRDTIDKVSRSHRMTTLRVRIGSEGRNPIWANLPLIYHRPLPPDAMIKWVYVSMYLVGTQPVWKCCFAISRESGFVKPDLADSGTVGIDVGWRLVPGGLRVAYWVADDGEEGELILPQTWLDAFPKIEERQGARDRSFNQAQTRLADWIDEHTADNREAWIVTPPEWLQERAEYIRQWRSAPRLWRLVNEWETKRFDGDEEIHDWLLSWYREERREHNGIDGQQRRLINQREEIYRQFAVEMRRRYHTAKVESLNWARMQQTAEPEEDQPDGAIKHYMRNAAVGRLLELLREHMAEVVGVPAKNTTRACHACGFVREIDGRDLIQTCDKCGVSCDQDRRAAINLLRGVTASTEVAEAVS